MMGEKMEQGGKIGIVCCSNGRKESERKKIGELSDRLEAMGLEPVFSRCIYVGEDGFNATSKQRALELMRFYEDDEIKGILDISGGDAANGILPCLNYEVIAKSSKLFWGYSDLTTIINGIYARTGRESILYPVKNLVGKSGKKQREEFQKTIYDKGEELFRISCKFIQHGKMEGIVVGGNTRCFLKLAGTEYMPKLKDRILLLESYGGTEEKIGSYFEQLKQLGAFDEAAGVLLGTFTEMEEKAGGRKVEELIRQAAGERLPIAVTKDIGHGEGTKAIAIGKKLYLEEERQVYSLGMDVKEDKPLMEK